MITSGIRTKDRLKRGIPHTPLEGKVLGLIFEKPSTRHTIFLSSTSTQIGRGEPIKDTARVMSGYVDGVMIRTFGHEIIEEFAEYSSVPVINGLTDMHHPCQVLADVMTITERKGGLAGLKVAWIGDGNNMANSWIEAAAILGFELSLACPDEYCPDEDVLAWATEKGANVKICVSVTDAVKGADVLNTDVWASMGQEKEHAERIKVFAGYQINADTLKLAKKDAMVMHCLPAHRGEEITNEAIEGPQSAVWQQAENRLHVQKAVLERLLK